MTKRAICDECSTRHNGVNYSKEGLAQLLAKEQAAHVAQNKSGVAWLVLLLLLAFPTLWLMTQSWQETGQAAVDLLQFDWAEWWSGGLD